MPRLSQVVQSFVTSFVRYLSAQSAEPDAIPEGTMVSSLLDVPHNDMAQSLRTMLLTLRRAPDYAFYKYVLHVISLLHAIESTKEPIPDEIILPKLATVIQFIEHCQALLRTSHRTSLTISYLLSGIETRLEIKGLLHKGWFSDALTPGGKILCDTIFPTLELSPSAPHETVVALLTGMVRDHQKDVLLIHQREEIQRLREENAALMRSISFAGLPPAFLASVPMDRAPIPAMFRATRRGHPSSGGFFCFGPSLCPRPLRLNSEAAREDPADDEYKQSNSP